MGHPQKTLLEKLFQNHATDLVRFLTRKLKNAQDAEDIAQNAFIRIQHLAEMGKLENPKAYLYQTASNLAIDQIRREKLHSNYVQGEITRGLTGSETSQSSTLSPERLLAARQDLTQMEQAITGLPLKCRQVFLLHRVKGMTYTEIARDMSISVSSVEKYILQALKACRLALAKSKNAEL
ncbi:RNA polymerase sigma factor [Exilibacterium tricleocarpae]|uniref:RNA polymerase sigma factor n=2 Tax=Exilibacterium tricleocarpae TaxID=2591008 RepID=A0A545U495_9GAMM|nr:RNA polymerase sigma factor [Exilibacterium tricleocarpae]